ncbi:MAG TPA: hypothetical protein VLG14_04485 [Sphingomonas sp.]|nr:hypothetical protein [Sphingomonas sp.]
MSSDQRPGKVRVFSSQAAEAPPTRRRDDPSRSEVPSGAETAAPPSPSAQATNVASPNRSIILAVTFLSGCAIGGGVAAWLGLIPGAAL